MTNRDTRFQMTNRDTRDHTQKPLTCQCDNPQKSEDSCWKCGRLLKDPQIHSKNG